MRAQRGGLTIPAMARAAAAAVVAVVLLAGCGSNSPTATHRTTNKTPVKKPATVTVRGSMTVQDPEGWARLDNGDCYGSNGYDDVGPGAAVVVSSDTGRTLAITQLDVGHVTGSGCRFALVPVRVPAGKRFYGVEVTHRGVVKIPEAELGAVALTIGS